MRKQIDYVDGFFTDEFIQEVATKYHTNLFEYGNVSNNPNDAIFWSSRRLNDNSPIADCWHQKKILDVISDYYRFKTFKVDNENIYINGQTYELDGSMHIDSGHRTDPDAHMTILYMVNWQHEGIQGFETNMGIVPFEPGRVVIFNSIMSHRGLSTESVNNLRMTLTWKSCEIVLDKTSPLVL